MIAPLRLRHRRVVTLLAFAVPALVLVAVGQRPDYDVQRHAHGASAPQTTGAMALDLFDSPPVQGHLRHEGTGAVLQVQTTAAPTRPDLLLYWSPDSPGDQLPANSVLLGALPSHALRLYNLPRTTAGGFVSLYSLAHQELVASSPLPDLDAPEAAVTLETNDGEAVDEPTDAGAAEGNR